MDKFENAEQQLETCMTIFNPLDIDIDVSEDNTITASLVCPKFAEDPANVKVIFDVYIVDDKRLTAGHTIEKSQRGDIKSYYKKNFTFSYRLPIAKKEVETLGGGETLLKVVDKDILKNGYKRLVSYLKDEINNHNGDDNIEDYNITLKLGNVKLYALAYVIIDNKVKKGDKEITIKSTRPNIAMHKYKLDEQTKTDYDDFMLEAVKDNIDKELKDKVYFFKTFKEIKDLKVEDILNDHSINSKKIPKQEDRFFVKVG
ncbi:hypothetical protein LO80_01540 [Candidatus Francisella endociliophora]|uniref:Uncharacterized protein n=1 Tax=Candidatus Francisella endociliophora TaxID=653937 RepID=A0A097EMI9_9GAMM|nr:hypothetical protein [Francisella sp. FSC1006]AIT08786.1 hypothetical protein LO80_01540 [Francisella sp. FSC1006]